VTVARPDDRGRREPRPVLGGNRVAELNRPVARVHPGGRSQSGSSRIHHSRSLVPIDDAAHGGGRVVSSASKMLSPPRRRSRTGAAPVRSGQSTRKPCSAVTRPEHENRRFATMTTTAANHRFRPGPHRHRKVDCRHPARSATAVEPSRNGCWPVAAGAYPHRAIRQSPARSQIPASRRRPIGRTQT